MMRMTSYGKQYADTMQRNPEAFDRSIRQTFGMSPNDLEMSLQCASALMAGRMPEGDALKWAKASAQKQYGWSGDRVSRELNSLLELSNPSDRLVGYLAAGSGNVPDATILDAIEGLVSSYAHTDIAVDLTHKLAEGRHDAPRDNFAKMPGAERAKAAATDRASIRDLVATQLGEANRPLTQPELRMKAETMRERLANRIETGVTFKEGASLRDSIADSYDVERVRAISRETGLPDFMEEAKANYAQDAYAYDHSVGIEDDLPADR